MTSTARVRLVEREGQLARLAAGLESAIAGRGRIAVVAAEAGGGKTALVTEFLAGRDVPAAVAVCDPPPAPVPFGVFVQLPSSVTSDCPDGAARAAALADALVRGDQDRVYRIALADLAAVVSPLVIVVEDVHWIDAASAELLGVLARRVSDVPVLLIITTRTEELPGQTPGQTLLGDLASVPFLDRVVLPPLSHRALTGLAEGSGHDPGQLARLTSGNPLLVSLLLAADPDTGLPSSLEFRHELVRDAITARIAPRLWRRLHAAALAADADGDPAVLAYHAEHAGDAASVHRHALAAAERAAALGSLPEAITQYRRVLRHGQPADAAERAGLWQEIASLQRLTGDLDDAVRAAHEALRLREAAQDEVAMVRTLLVASSVCWVARREPESERALARADEIATANGDRAGQALVRSHRAGKHMLRGRLAAARGDSEAVLTAAEELGMPELRAPALTYLGQALLGRDQRAIDLLRQAVACASTPTAENACWVNLAEGAATLRAGREGELIVADALAVLDRKGAVLCARMVHASHARLLLDLGRYGEAARAAERALDGPNPERAIALTVLALVAARTGDRAAAGATIAEALHAAEDYPDGATRAGPARIAAAEIAWLAGDTDAAAGHAVAGLAVPNVTELAWPAGELAVWLARCGGDPPALPEFPLPPYAELDGDYAGAAAGWRRLNAPYEAALAMLAKPGGRDKRALAVLHELGATAAIAAAPGTRGRRATGPLTQREYDVLSLVAEGLRNGEIAGKLYLSVRTVEQHLTAVMRKLGVHSRTAAVLAAQADGLLTAVPAPTSGTPSPAITPLPSWLPEPRRS